MIIKILNEQMKRLDGLYGAIGRVHPVQIVHFMFQQRRTKVGDI